jgi:UDP-glucose 4-epimerase
MTTLVTGARGFIGAYVVDRLLDGGQEVLAFDKTDSGVARAGVTRVLGDVRDAAAVHDAMAHADGWIHLAGILGTQETILHPLAAAETNVLGGLNVLQAASAYGVPGVNIAVGNHWMDNTYSITKSTVERFARMYRVERDLVVSNVRALNAYGPRQSVARPYGDSTVRKIMPSFVCRALSGAPIEVYGDGAQVMDMVYVEDVAEVLVLALGAAREGDAIDCDAGTGRATTVLDIANAVIEAVGGGAVSHLPMRPGEPERSVVLGDPATLFPLGVSAGDLVPLEEGVARTVAHYRDYLAARVR